MKEITQKDIDDVHEVLRQERAQQYVQELKRKMYFFSHCNDDVKPIEIKCRDRVVRTWYPADDIYAHHYGCPIRYACIYNDENNNEVVEE